MSVLVKGMKMPRDCYECKAWSQCFDEKPSFNMIKSVCPLVEVKEPHWIPCSERLPKAKQKVLVQYADESMATKRCNDEGHLQWFYANAVAWMPAPEPYKEVTE